MAQPAAAASLPLAHRKRLREVWRSAGWPCRDLVEVDLLAAGLLERHVDGDGRETLRLSGAGIQALAATVARNRVARSAHEALVARVAEQMQREGRLVWRGLALRAALDRPSTLRTADGGEAPTDPAAAPGPALLEEPAPAPSAAAVRWAIAMPDVFSIRHTTVAAYTEPAVHEIKVRRADLLADLKRPDKGAAYCALSSQCWYVLGAGVGRAEEIPEAYGVLVDTGRGLELARPAPRRAVTPDFATWMALARANVEPAPEDAAQAPLRPEA